MKLKTPLKIIITGVIFLLAVVNYAFYDAGKDKFEDKVEMKLRKKHFCPPDNCFDAESVLNFSLERNRWCFFEGKCGPTSVNTVFVADIEAFQGHWNVTKSGGEIFLSGKYLVPTWKCSHLTSPDPHLKPQPRSPVCQLNAVRDGQEMKEISCCYPGPFLANGHLHHSLTQCQAAGC